MTRLRWIVAAATAVVCSVSSTTAAAQTCASGGFVTCATAATPAPVLRIVWQPRQDTPNPRHDDFFVTVQGCPSPNGENGAVSVAENNPHCSGTTPNGGTPSGTGTPSSNGAPNGGGPLNLGSAPDFSATVAPEPASLILLGTGLVTLGAGMMKRRRRRE